MRSFLKTGVIDRMSVVDGETGEVTQDRIKKYKYLAKNKEEFYIIYTSLIGVFKKLSAPEAKLYCHLLERYPIGTDIIIVNKYRVKIGQELGISQGTVANALGTLTKKRLIYSTERGFYKLNPRYAFQGSTAERNKMLKMILEVECPDC